jgi:hypothetical protein
LNDVEGLTTDDVWAVGMANDSYDAKWPLIEHWDGQSWTVKSDRSLPGEELAGVYPIAADDVWAAGFFSRRPLLLHYDGQSWSMVPAPPTDSDTLLKGISGTGPDDVWALGYNYLSSWKTIVMHYDGQSWSLAPSPTPNTRAVLYDVASISKTNAYAVGFSQLDTGPYRPLVERWNGVAWRVLSHIPTKKGNTSLAGATAVPGGIVAVGTGQPDPSLVRFKPFVIRGGGSSWAVQQADSGPLRFNDLYDVAMLPSGDGWAVGKSWITSTNSSSVPLALSYCP